MIGDDIFEQEEVAEEVIGTAIVAIATIISMVGVAFNNIVLDHTSAMQIWMVSNILFAGFFYGQYKGFWDGGLPSAILCVFYIFCTITGMYGLMFT